MCVVSLMVIVSVTVSVIAIVVHCYCGSDGTCFRCVLFCVWLVVFFLFIAGSCYCLSWLVLLLLLWIWLLLLLWSCIVIVSVIGG